MSCKKLGSQLLLSTSPWCTGGTGHPQIAAISGAYSEGQEGHPEIMRERENSGRTRDRGKCKSNRRTSRTSLEDQFIHWANIPELVHAVLSLVKISSHRNQSRNMSYIHFIIFVS